MSQLTSNNNNSFKNPNPNTSAGIVRKSFDPRTSDFFAKIQKGVLFREQVNTLVKKVECGIYELSPKGIEICVEDSTGSMLYDFLFEADKLETFRFHNSLNPNAKSVQIMVDMKRMQSLLRPIKKKFSICLCIPKFGEEPRQIHLIMQIDGLNGVEVHADDATKTRKVSVSILHCPYKIVLPIDEHYSDNELPDTVLTYSRPVPVPCQSFQILKKTSTYEQKFSITICPSNGFFRFGCENDLFGAEIYEGLCELVTNRDSNSSSVECTLPEFIPGEAYTLEFPTSMIVSLSKLSVLGKNILFSHALNDPNHVAPIRIEIALEMSKVCVGYLKLFCKSYDQISNAELFKK